MGHIGLPLLPGNQESGGRPRAPAPPPLRIVLTRLSEVGGSDAGAQRARTPGRGPGVRDNPISALTPLRPPVPSLAGRLPQVGLARGDPGPTPRPPARRCLPPAAARVSPRETGGGRAAPPAAPPRAPSRPAGRPPRRAPLRRSSRLCNVSSRSGGGDASGSGRGPAVAPARLGPAGAHGASPQPPRCLGALRATLRARRGARTSGQPGCGRAQRTADTGLRGLRPGTGPGTAGHAAPAARLRSPGGRSPSHSGPRPMTAATQRPASAPAAGSAAPRLPVRGVAGAAPR